MGDPFKPVATGAVNQREKFGALSKSDRTCPARACQKQLMQL